METLKISSEVLTQLEDLALKHNLTVNKVIENLLEYYFTMQQVTTDTPILLEADNDGEEFSPEDMRQVFREMTDAHLAQQTRRSA